VQPRVIFTHFSDAASKANEHMRVEKISEKTTVREE